MSLFKNYVENQENLVSGPGIQLLKSTFNGMFNRGAPVEYDDTGFNKPDFMSFRRITGDPKYHEDAIPVAMANNILSILNRYKKTQVTHYEDIKAAVNKDIKDSLSLHSQEDDKITIDNNAPKQYGKVKVLIPGGIDKTLSKRIEAIIVQKKNLQKTLNKFGKYQYEAWRYFSQDKNTLDTYYISPEVIDEIVELVAVEKKIGVKKIGAAAAVVATGTRTGSSDINVIGVEETQRYGKRLAIQFNVPFEKSKALFDAVKAAGLSPSGMAYERNPTRFLLSLDRKIHDQVIKKFSEFGIDAKPVDDFMEKNQLSVQSAGTSPEEEKPTSGSESAPANERIEFMDPSKGRDDKLNIKILYTRVSPQQKEFLRELVQYTFPNYEWDRDNYSYIVRGNFKQYVSFGATLKKFGYMFEITDNYTQNPNSLKLILQTKLKNGGVKKTKYEGEVPEGLKDKIEEKLPESKFELYDQQKDGVTFLYGRNHAILGDETGYGKTAMLISAAELKMQDTPGAKTLVITLKSVQQQWVDEIKNVVGDKSEISTDALNPKKWTVLYYDNFSSGKQVDNVVKSVSGTNFEIAIFDELHKLKHSTSKRSQNILVATQNIPYKWGASATISANKPMDVKNQLIMIGHPLGSIKEGKFKKDFAGMVPGGYGGSYIEGTFRDKIKAAEKLNRWLNLSGVYVRRTKNELREMPNLEVNAYTTDVDTSEFSKKLKEKLKAYKDPNLAISELIASREILAHLKVDSTVDKALKIINSNKEKSENNYAASKVVIFTNFVQSGEQINNKLSAKLKEINPNFKVITYLSSTKKAEREKVKELFTNDPNAKALVMSMKMGGTGISFPNAAQNMIVNDFDWTPESSEQSEGRIYRINTNHSVKIDYTLAPGLDTEIYEAVQRKRKLAEIIQRYRKEYQDVQADEKLLQKLIDTQVEANKIDEEIKNLIAKAASKSMEEAVSFSDYLKILELGFNADT
jgi:hypothetical protein